MSERPFDQHAPGTTADTAKQEAASVGQDVKDSAGQVAQTAMQEAQHVAQEARGQAQSLLREVTGDVTGQARDQQQRAAQGLHGLADQFSQMAQGAEGTSMATGLVQQAAERMDGVADWLEVHEPADLLDSVKRYARRNPGTFLAICGLVGFAGGRLTRGLRDDAAPDSGADYGHGYPGGRAGYGAPVDTAYQGRSTYEPVADAGVYATTTGVPTAYATREQPSGLDTAAEPLPVGDELIAQDDELIGRDDDLIGDEDGRGTREDGDRL
jgi:hypothetical protein